MAQVCFTPETVSGKLKVVAGTVTLDGGNPTPVDLSKFFKTAIVAAVASYSDSAAPADDHSIVTCSISGTTINLYAWVHAAADPTLQASTSNSAVVNYIAVGY